MSTNELRKLQVKATAIAKTLEERKKDDPIFNFQLHKKQQEFDEAVSNPQKSEVWCFGGNRSGKSDIGSYCGAKLARFGPLQSQFTGSGDSFMEVRSRATSGWVVSLDFPTSRDIIQPKYFANGMGYSSHPAFIPEREIKEWRQADQILVLHNGSIIGFKSADSGRGKFQGVEKDWIHFDEEPPKEVYEECTVRIGTKRLLIFGTCTLLPPEGQVGGVTWLFDEIAKPYMNHSLRDNVHVVQMSMYDNPHLPKDAIEQYCSRYKPDSVEFRIRVLGELLPGLSGARAYTGFDYATHVRPQEEYYNPNAPLCWYMDFNVNPYITGVGQRDGAKFRFMEEFLLEEGNHDAMCELFYERYNQHAGEIWVYGDASGQRRSLGKSDAFSDYTVIVNNLRAHGKYIKLKLPTFNPNVPDRVNAMNVAFRNSAGLSNIEIDPKCTELIADFEQVLRDPRGGIKKSNNSRDPYYRRTHSSDGAGYWVAYEAPITQHRTINRQNEFMSHTMRSPRYGFTKAL